MKTKVALVNLRYKLDINFEQKESLAIGYLASVLINNNYEVDVIDAQYFNLEVEEVFQHLIKKKYTLIGFSLYQETVYSFAKLHHLLLKANLNTHICLGGQFPSFTAELLLQKFSLVNSIVIGEGENTLLELVNSLSSGNDNWKKVNGICYLQKGQIVYSDPRQLIPDLDNLAYPWRDAYYANLDDPSSVSAIISASRGCYAKCSFCSIQSFYAKLKGKRIRVRSPEKVVNEIEDIYNRFKIKNFFFADDNFLVANLVRKNWITRFVDELERRQLDIQFDMDCRVNDIDIYLFKRLKKNGLNGVFLGIESFNQRTLDTLYKEVTVQQNLDAIRILKSMRINVWMGFIMFDMFTTLDEIREDVAALDKIKYFKYINYDRPLSSDWVASILQLYNGTPVLEMMKEKHSDLLVRDEFGYKFKFQHKETEQFYQVLQLWKPIIKDMIQVDTLWLIRLAKSMHQYKLSEQLHLLSRRYMSIDRAVFLELLDAIEKDKLSKTDEIINVGRQRLSELKNLVTSIKHSIIENKVSNPVNLVLQEGM